MRWETVSLLQFFEDFYQPQKLCGGADATIRSYRIEIGHLCRWLEFRQWEAAGAGAMYDADSVDRHAVKLGDLSDELVAGCLQWRLAQGIAPPTVNKMLRHILPLWRYARRKFPAMRRAIADPMVEKVTEVEHLPEAWSDDEFARIMRQARSMNGLTGSHSHRGKAGKSPACVFWPAFIGTVYDVAGRYSDVFHLPTTKFDGVAGVVRMQVDKQHFEKHFELSWETVADLRALQPFFNDRLFGDWQMSKRVLSTHYQRFILQPAGLSCDNPERRACQVFHKLRRTMLTNITIEHGIDEAQKYAGHSHQSVTRRYVDPTKLKATVSARSMPRPVTSGLRIRDAETG